KPLAQAPGSGYTLADRHPKPRVAVARLQHRDPEWHLVVRRIGEIAARIEVATGGAPDMAASRPARDELARYDPRGARAIEQRRRGVVEPDDFVKMRRELVKQSKQGPDAVGADIVAHAAGNDVVHQQPMPEYRLACRQHALAKHTAMAVQKRERGVVANRADVAEVVGHALELGHDGADHLRARRNFR